MTIKVRMIPHIDHFDESAPSGVQKVVQKYFEYLPRFDVEMVKPSATSYDLLALHAGAYDSFMPHENIVSHCHGLYWTDDYEASAWEHDGNQRVIEVLRHAALVTVPSAWVAEALRRDMHINPGIAYHGVEWEEWQGGSPEGYVLWNKNRMTDVCDPTPVSELAKLMPDTRFLTTYAVEKPPRNVRVLGTVRHSEMQRLVKGASLYLATTKETFGIGTLEALAAGVPVLGYDYGGTADLVQHGRTGYLAQPGDYEDLVHGAYYLTRNRKRISAAARDYARLFGWQQAVQNVAQQYADTLQESKKPHKVAVVIPAYNKAGTLERALRSALKQTLAPSDIVIVNNNSTDNTREVALRLLDQLRAETGPNLTYMNCQAQGVAHARNAGIDACYDATYIVCLDADDEIKPDFIKVCTAALDADRALAIAYTGIEAVKQDGSTFISEWPGQYNFEEFMAGRNQVPTCCMFRREMWKRSGGYRQRYAPTGAGSEDAELWLRMGALGGGGEKVSEEGLFRYHLGGQVSGNPNYKEVNWRAGKPWIEDKRHPFASVAQPANDVAHLVRQVDQPLISVIVPCGPKHGQFLADCMDSVENQTCRQWEVILVADVDQVEWRQIHDKVLGGFPFVRLHRTPAAGMGAGYARNAGAALARGHLLVFLDADDTLAPHALNDLLAGYMATPMSIVYGDYIGHAYLSVDSEANRLRGENRLLDYDPKTKLAKVLYHSLEYNCERALKQPDARQPYIWNVVTSLIPRAFHQEVGGFDETMESWEDWDYWLRLARAGKCFTRIATPILEYKFYTGGRRALANPTESGENGRQLSEKLLSYMQSKYEGIGAMPCRSCGGGRTRKTTPPSTPMMAMTMNEGVLGKMAASDLVWVTLIDGNLGSHRIMFEREMYGYRSHGETFKMGARHAQLDNRVRPASAEEIAIATGQSMPEAEMVALQGSQLIQVPPAPKRELPPEEPQDLADLDNDDNDLLADEDDDQVDEDALMIEEGNRLGLNLTQTAKVVKPEGAPVTGEIPEGVTLVPAKQIFDFTKLWGIGPERQATLLGKGVRSLTGLIALDVVGIQKTLEVPEATAERILKAAKAEAAR